MSMADSVTGGVGLWCFQEGDTCMPFLVTHRLGGQAKLAQALAVGGACRTQMVLPFATRLFKKNLEKIKMTVRRLN